MRFGTDFLIWGPMILGAILIAVGIFVGESVGALCVAFGAGFCFLGICVMMSDLIIRMSSDEIMKGGRKGKGPF